MVTEKDYLEALDRAIKTKKQYLAAELENEGRSLLASLEDDSWSEKERIQQHPLLERLNPDTELKRMKGEWNNDPIPNAEPRT